MLGCRHAIQVVGDAVEARRHPVGEGEILVASASQLLDCLV
jgi:hypothetical protein